MRAATSLLRVGAAPSPSCALRSASSLLHAAPAPSLLHVAPRRRFASPPSVMDPTARSVEGAPAAAVEPAPARAAPSAPAPAGSTWQRLTSFLTGVGVASIFFFYSLAEDLSRSNASVDASLAAFHKEAEAANVELRQRLAVLEHKVAQGGAGRG